MKNEKTMQINKETAMYLWKKSFGKAQKAVDFSGREMAKAAYNDRNSEYGWNIDHILPKSKGGKDTESNLICVHILTNDEKGDSFPCFTANNKKFEIIKVQNHYEIREITNNNSSDNSSTKEHNIDLFNASAGVKFYKKLKGTQNKSLFVGTVYIELFGLNNNTALIDFITEIFKDKNISFSSNHKFCISIKDYNMPQKSDTQDMLDRCVLLNTYLKYYFVKLNVISDYYIFYGVYTDSNKLNCLTQNIVENENGYQFIINKLVYINTDAKELAKNPIINEYGEYTDFYDFDYFYVNLKNELNKIL